MSRAIVKKMAAWFLIFGAQIESGWSFKKFYVGIKIRSYHIQSISYDVFTKKFSMWRRVFVSNAWKDLFFDICVEGFFREVRRRVLWISASKLHARLFPRCFLNKCVEFDFWPFIALSISSARGLYVIEIWAYSGTVWVETHYKL